MPEKIIQWIVCVQIPAAAGNPARLEYWGAFDNAADDQAHVPFTQEVAEGVAAGVNMQHDQTGVSAMAYPLTETLQPGV